jgi:Flp pilus assembly pilin Flp
MKQAGIRPGASTYQMDDGVSPLVMIARFVEDESGVTSIEYGIIAVAISVACIAGIALVGAPVQALYASIGAAITAAL